MSGALHKGHRARFRQRYRETGLESFADHEVLELLLFYCYPQRNTNDIAHRMLREFGSLPHLFEADVETLVARLGCSENIAVLLNLMPAIAKRYFNKKWGEKIILDNPKTAGEYAQSLFVGLTCERFYVLSVDARNRLNHASLISQGTLDEAAIYPREVVKAAVHNQASAVILAHNHPGGTLKPSRGDLEVTRQIVTGLEFINVIVLDHIIVAGDAYYSFAQRRQFVAGYG
ncbi:MAG: DNA repair protein RadC [Defluviitaleaceae bacterium]|nr:DNA repair protein RadC [Defluviitaleaceae bacterium]MCL2239699.1 DNA repair protein RadC [Defluviitaleaceae bacterium]